MRIRRTKSIILIALLTALRVPAGASEIHQFNNGWRFNLCGDGWVQDCSSPSFDDKGWRILDVPHDWSIEGKYDKENPSGGSGGYMPCGTAWYRKHFSLDSKYEDKRFFIQFDGVYMDSKVWINGHMVGEYPNGYNSFEYDITPFVNTDGSDNVLAVKVDNSLQPASRWYSGSGIYRDVRLLIDNQTHFAHDGTFARTLKADLNKATLAVDCRVITNAFPETEFEWFVYDMDPHAPDAAGRVSKHCEVRFFLMDGDITVAQCTESKIIRDFSENDFKAVLDVSNPRLWSSRTPDLYTLICELNCEGETVDRQEMKVGLREIRFSAEEGMTVNGVPEKIQGICIHQSAGCFGSAVPKEVWEYRLKQLKSMGCNALRLAHYPHAPFIYELCDELGIYVSDEVFDEWNRGQEWGYSESPYGKTEYSYYRFFEQWHATDLKNMIRRDRNHACLILYILGNEIPNQRIKGVELARELVGIVRNEDPTRPVTAACDFFVGAKACGFMNEQDISGYNYIDRVQAEDLYVSEHALYPDRILLGTETFHSYKNPAAIRDCTAAIGEFVWTGFDYLGEIVSEDMRGWQDGIFDVCGFPKPEYYLRKSYWSDEPVVYPAVFEDDGRDFDWKVRPVKGHWNWDGRKEVAVYAYSNCEEAELRINGRRYQRKAVDADSCCVCWNVPYKPGKLTVTGFNKGRKAAEWTLETTENRPVSVAFEELNDSDHMAIIKIMALDSKGRIIPTCSEPFKVNVTGCSVAGIDNGNQYDPDGRKYSSKSEGRFYEGQALIYIRKDGVATINVSMGEAVGTHILTR